jgi:hypothetical protein
MAAFYILNRSVSRIGSKPYLGILAAALGLAVWTGPSAGADQPAPPVPAPPSEVKSLKLGLDEAAVVRADAEARIALKREKLVQALQEMLDEYTRQGLMNQAQAVREQIDLQKGGAVPSGAICVKADDAQTMTEDRSHIGKSLCFRVTGGSSGALWGTDLYTDDSAIATAAVHAGILQMGESGVVKVTMLPGLPVYQGSARNGIQSNDWKNSGTYSSYKIERGCPAVAADGARPSGPVVLAYPAVVATHAPTMQLIVREADVAPAEIGVEAGPSSISPQSVGQSFLMQVTGGTSGFVWGTEKYTHDSSIPAAAVHAGVLQVGETALMKVSVLAGLPYYQGSTHNGVKSLDWNNTAGYVSIVIERAPTPKAAAAPATMTDYVQSIGSSFTFNVTGATTGSVWGTDLYTNDSSLAAAAVHAGVLQPGETALVKVTMLPGVPQYHGSTHNGVTTLDWDNSPGHYVSYVVECPTARPIEKLQIYRSSRTRLRNQAGPVTMYDELESSKAPANAVEPPGAQPAGGSSSGGSPTDR